MNSLDPRVNRLPEIGNPQNIQDKEQLDQFGTFEVFVQPKEGKPFQHEGALHAPNLEMAYILAKETFTRRFTCTSLYVVDTRNVYVSPITERDQNAYDLVENVSDQSKEKRSFEIYHLLKRGKQHVHVGSVKASTPQEAMSVAKNQLNAGKVFNIWSVASNDIRFTSDEEKELWLTLPEKKFRDAADYKGGEKLSSFLERRIKESNV
ncbi:MAG TPA: phenylacetic acid degradation b [Chryseolinea sp.]|nr:phenylacetic acid degradation b [Chryseolinea sp.]HPH46630.1 phenylacetic acid degradation b [Chryseolinea sp.]HPM31264.1 phenylacetic acid degradation b [Chryseolinea sp.]